MAMEMCNSKMVPELALETFSGKTTNLPIETSCVQEAEEEKNKQALEDSSYKRKPLQIVMLVAGSRGDVQPYIAVGTRFKELGHRVRLATHTCFEDFVLSSGLEFFPLGGDPKVFCDLMVRSRGFPKSFSDVTRSRNQLKAIVFSLFPACNDPDLKSGLPFKADAIIGNQIAYGHQHVAKALNIPLQLLLMAPITPTSEFPNPFCRLKHKAVYKISHYIYDALMWLGTKDFINSMRKSLNLRPVTYLRSVRGTLYDLPTIYAFSSFLLPKPKEWGENIEIIGPCFLQLPSDFEPPKTLTEWIKAGKKPIYVGFGSMPINDPDTIAQVIVEAFEITGQRCIFGKCWSNIDKLKCYKDLIYVVDDCPHDWLFKQCAAVVHHGGCGTTFAGLKAACPTTVVPFFGEQFIWAERVYQKGLGPYPIQIEEFSAKYLVDAINFMLNPEVKERAAKASEIIGLENGSDGAVEAFFKFYSIYINKTQQTST